MHTSDKDGSHFGRDKMRGVISNRFWWLGCQTDINEWVSTCPTCQKKAKVTGVEHAELHSISLEGTGVWHRLGIDLTHLPKSNRGYVCLLTIIDYFSKFPFAIPLKNKKSKTVAKELDKLFREWGAPRILLA